MASTGEAELMQALWALFVSNSELAAAGVFYGMAPQEDELPYLLYSLVPYPPNKKFGLVDSWRFFQVQVKACATHDGGQQAPEIAIPLKNAAYTLLSDGQAAADRLNEYLVPLGWRALVPLEQGDLQPFADYIGRDRSIARWQFGFRCDLRIQAL